MWYLVRVWNGVCLVERSSDPVSAIHGRPKTGADAGVSIWRGRFRLGVPGEVAVIPGCGDRYRTWGEYCWLVLSWLLSSYPLLPVTFFLPSFLPNALFISLFQSVHMHYRLFTSYISFTVIPPRQAGHDLKRPGRNENSTKWKARRPNT